MLELPSRKPPDRRTSDPGAQLNDDALSRARFDCRWQNQFNLGSNPERVLEPGVARPHDVTLWRLFRLAFDHGNKDGGLASSPPSRGQA